MHQKSGDSLLNRESWNVCLCSDWRQVGIRDSQVNRLIWDGWLLCLGFWGFWGMLLPGKKLEIWGFQTAGNALKLSILPSPTLFLYRLKSFTIPSGGPFWFLGAGVRTPLPRAYGPGQLLTRSNGARFLSYKRSIKLTRLWGWPFYPGTTFLLINGLWLYKCLNVFYVFLKNLAGQHKCNVRSLVGHFLNLDGTAG